MTLCAQRVGTRGQFNDSGRLRAVISGQGAAT